MELRNGITIRQACYVQDLITQAEEGNQEVKDLIMNEERKKSINERNPELVSLSRIKFLQKGKASPRQLMSTPGGKTIFWWVEDFTSFRFQNKYSII